MQKQNYIHVTKAVKGFLVDKFISHIYEHIQKKKPYACAYAIKDFLSNKI
ncbi:unnamed protein product [Larinioides sclopetarius]|uniref:Uncharacterized protein n=1 Tax=Larinioides sclopetarius TaxID=280406 RepID=A0AAV1YTI5_9ARAC